MSENTTITEPATFYPGLQYQDADQAIEWLVSTLSCRERDVHRDDEGAVVHAELEFQGAVIMLSSAGVGREPFRSLPAGESFVYVAISDPDRLHDQAVAAGAEVAVPLTDTDYGSRDFTLRDPEGNLWAFGTYRPAAI